MRLHAGGEHPVGQAKVVLAEITGMDAGILHQVDDLLELARRINKGSGSLAGRDGQLLQNQLSALLLVDDHPGRAQQFAVVSGVYYPDRSVGEKAMAAALIAADYPGHFILDGQGAVFSGQPTHGAGTVSYTHLR